MLAFALKYVVHARHMQPLTEANMLGMLDVVHGSDHRQFGVLRVRTFGLS